MHSELLWPVKGLLGFGLCLQCIIWIIPVPYGRHADHVHPWIRPFTWPRIPGRLAWFILESPAWCIYLPLLLWKGEPSHQAPGNRLLQCMFLGHHLNRSLISPYLLPLSVRPMPWSMLLSGVILTGVNGYIQSREFSALGPIYRWNDVLIVRWMIGICTFIAGMVANIASDQTLRHLASKKKHGKYSIPYGGLFQWWSAPNYVGEVVEWIGYAIAAGWNPVAWTWAGFTAMNLLPRAVAHHRWYCREFGERYPRRWAIIPGIY